MKSEQSRNISHISGNLGKQQHKFQLYASKERKKQQREMRLLKQVDKQRQLQASTETQSREGSRASPWTQLNFPSRHLRRPFTLSLAVAGSIMDNAQTPELRAHLAGQVARAAAIFCVDEVVVFNDQGSAAVRPGPPQQPLLPPDSCRQMALLLQYMECPQYLRRRLFPVHEHLRHAGLLSPLDCPHHLRRDQLCRFREGVVVPPPAPADDNSQADDEQGSCWVDVGLAAPVRVDRQLQCGVRVTVRLSGGGSGAGGRGKIVAPRQARRRLGVYWGYSVRVADSLSRVFTESQLAPNGYDLLVGTSDGGTPLTQLSPASLREQTDSRTTSTTEDGGRGVWRHVLVVFGGLQGLEAALDNDDQLTVQSVHELFDLYVNACLAQGTRTIRSEEALLITLPALLPLLTAAATMTERRTDLTERQDDLTERQEMSNEVDSHRNSDTQHTPTTDNQENQEENTQQEDNI